MPDKGKQVCVTTETHIVFTKTMPTHEGATIDMYASTIVAGLYAIVHHCSSLDYTPL